MRPRRLEIEGFTSFRERTVVDFDGADLFALSGPTGAGKSSLIDAIVFALYGTVPRYDDQRAVAPVISQARNEAVLGLTFSVGADDYQATRVVRRTKGKGATTKEARLERLVPGGDPEVIAGSADELTEAVEDLLGLGFEHFTRAVVLPQGEFAQFLLDKPKDRQALLMRLLDFGVYEQAGRLARARADGLGHERDVIDGKLDEIGETSPELVAAVAARCEKAEALEAALGAAEPRLQRLGDEQREATAAVSDADVAITAMTAIAVPAGVGDLAADQASTRHALTSCEKIEDSAAGELEAAETALKGLRDASELAKLIASHDRRAGLAAEVDAAEAELAPLAAEAADAAAASTAAEARLDAAAADLRAVEHANLAHTLAGTLVAGDACPVCGQTVSVLPARTTPAEIPAAEAALADAKREAETATKRTQAAKSTHDSAAALLDRLRNDVAELDTALASEPTAAECAAKQHQREDHESTVAKARGAFDAARKATAEARRAHDRAADAAKEARVVFGRARDSVAAWSPPEPGGTDLAEDWAALLAWAASLLPARREAREKAQAASDAAKEAADALVGELSAQAEPLGVAAGSLADLRSAIPKAAAQARGEHGTAVANLERAQELRARSKELEAARAVADTLGRHLKADAFQTWLQREAQEQLVAGANAILADLSRGAYSLALDEKANFDVVDHHNADQLRSARTLSGGETFLVSLALALALGDHIASMAAHGTARLESLFLDEGFGTLDPDTLDVVSSAIAELGASGRMVGLVTHVRDLAETVPVRFEVTKGPGGSAVERVDT